MNKEMFPHLYELDLLGGINTDKGQEYVTEHKKEVEDEYNLLIANLFERGETFGKNEDIHKGGE